MLASFFDTSNSLFGYIANFFFAATFFSVIARLVYKLITRHYDNKVDEVKDDMNEQFRQLLAEHRPNGGSSSKDQWNKIEKLVEELRDGQVSLHQQIDTVRDRIVEHEGYHKGLDARED